ncbi:hypothetical protein POM88_044754 [Heracleum sosnowskyi]|uniref:Uncharacterized protein n=1 Tax=Heracleum sosnowskyi TaxID=360622 RepID=A0AAD8H627_9APIA|nr:hypothetical protein POM88_044754 [Heracleum sosnowskyi]
MAHGKIRSKLRRSSLYTFGCFTSQHEDAEQPHQFHGPGYSRTVYCNQPRMHHRSLLMTHVSPFRPVSMIGPLAVVIGFSMAKEAVEDWRRFIQDMKVNLRKASVRKANGVFAYKPWFKIQVGDVVKVEKDQFFPADLLLLSSSYEDGICYVETMNLDGETNLKIKRSLEILLRDSKLRNTAYVYGVVIYTGPDSKVMQNSTESPSKRSKIESRWTKLFMFSSPSLFLSQLLAQ